MNTDLLSAGEFAKLAVTTKRTVQFYDIKRLLRPVKTASENGYRYYEPRQIIDLQFIMLLRRLNFSLGEIKRLIKKHTPLAEVFHSKRTSITSEVEKLTRMLRNIDRLYTNLGKTGTMINPKIVPVKPRKIYYIDKIGSYAKIDSYCKELLSMFTSHHSYETTLTLFEEEGYRPKSCKMKIGTPYKQKLSVKPKYKNIVKIMTIPGYKALIHRHFGPGELLSLSWKELEKYAERRRKKRDLSLGFDLEYYIPEKTKVHTSDTGCIMEIHMPIY